MPVGDTATDTTSRPNELQNYAALGLQRDPTSGRWTYHSTIPSTLTAEELGSMPFGELRGQIYSDTQQQYGDFINANLAKQAEALNIAEESKAMTEGALENFGEEARFGLEGKYQQQLAKIDPRLGGTTISSNQRYAAGRDYATNKTNLEQQIAESKVRAMQPEYRNIQNLLTMRTDTPPDMAGMNRMMMASGMAGLGSGGPDTPEWWEGPLAGAVGNWAMTPGGYGGQQGSPMTQTINSIFGLPGGWGDQQGGGGMGGILGGGGGGQGGGGDGWLQQGLEGLGGLLGFGGGDEGGGGSWGNLPDFDMFGAPGGGDMMGGLGDMFQMPRQWRPSRSGLSPIMGGGQQGGGMMDTMGGLTDLLGMGGGMGSMGIGGGMGGIGQGLLAAGPYAAAAAAAYGAYELWDHNKEDIRRETGRIGEQIQDETKRTGKRIEKEFKRGVKKVKSWFDW